MDLGEIKLGNWLQISYFNGKSDICRVVKSNLNSYEIETLEKQSIVIDSSDKMKQLTQIPINEDILKCLGFIEEESTYKFFGKITETVNNDITAQKDGDMWIISKGDGNVAKIQVLHILQNFLADNDSINFDELFRL